jgi:hypothetical protein
MIVIDRRVVVIQIVQRCSICLFSLPNPILSDDCPSIHPHQSLFVVSIAIALHIVLRCQFSKSRSFTQINPFRVRLYFPRPMGPLVSHLRSYWCFDREKGFNLSACFFLRSIQSFPGCFFFFLKFGFLDVDLSKLKGFLERFHAPPHLLLDFWTLIFGFDFNIVWQEYENEMTEMDNYNLIPGVGMHGMAALRPQDWRTHTRMANPMAAALVSGSLNQGLGRRNFGRRRSRNAGSSDTYET